jgi:hypothetical protein
MSVKKFIVATPYPPHGLDHAMGLRETSLYTAIFIYGITGTIAAVSGMTWIFYKDWPLNIGGNPYFALDALIPNRDYLPSSWLQYHSSTICENGLYLGTFGLLFTCFFLFAKNFPVTAIAEVKGVLKRSRESYKEKMNHYEVEAVEKFAEQHAH